MAHASAAAAAPLEDAGARPFDKISNFRDVAVSVNQASDRPLLKPNMLYRSAELDDCSKTDGDRLRVDYGVNTILDLRQMERKFIYKGKFIPTDDDGFVTTKTLGVTHTSISLDGSGIAWERIHRLSLSGKFKFGRHVIFGHEAKAFEALNTTIATYGLVGLACDCLDHSGARIHAIFKALADPAAYPVLVHCRNGKEVTGLVMLLVQLLLGVPVAVAQADYARSDAGLALQREERLATAQQRGLGAEWVDCAAGWAEGIVEHIKANYGGIGGYLVSIGVDKQIQDSIIALLRPRSGERLLDRQDSSLRDGGGNNT